jgi:cysteine-rich repeat protein
VEPNLEACDNGFNDDTYEIFPSLDCAPGCVRPPHCGDGLIDGYIDPIRAGEQCDDGINDGRYGGCTAECLLARYCGDSVVSEEDGEECDDGNQLRGDGCAGCRGEGVPLPPPPPPPPPTDPVIR